MMSGNHHRDPVGKVQEPGNVGGEGGVEVVGWLLLLAWLYVLWLGLFCFLDALMDMVGHPTTHMGPLGVALRCQEGHPIH